MAIILNGPLAARVTGSIGEIEFRYTKFGQVAQAKTVSGVWTTPDAMLTKNRFRYCMKTFGTVDPYLKDVLALAAHGAGKTVMQQWVSSVYKLLQGDPWYYPDTYRSTYHLLVQDYHYDDDQLWVALGPKIDFPIADARFGFIIDHDFEVYWNWMANIAIDEELHTLYIPPSMRPCTIVFFPRFKSDPAAVGHSAGIHIPLV